MRICLFLWVIVLFLSSCFYLFMFFFSFTLDPEVSHTASHPLHPLSTLQLFLLFPPLTLPSYGEQCIRIKVSKLRLQYQLSNSLPSALVWLQFSSWHMNCYVTVSVTQLSHLCFPLLLCHLLSFLFLFFLTINGFRYKGQSSLYSEGESWP